MNWTTVTMLLTPLIGVCGVAVALSAIWWNRRMARLKATLDLIEGSESKEYYQRRYEAFRQFRRAGAAREAIADPDNGDTHELRTQCLDFLNHYELVAIACRRGLIDETFYRDWMGPTVLRDWSEAAPLIRRARMPRHAGETGNPLAYCEFERLARRWGGRPFPRT